MKRVVLGGLAAALVVNLGEGLFALLMKSDYQAALQKLGLRLEATLELVREVGYASAFTFKYSSRPGTPAAAMPRQVAEAVKDERLQRLQALLDGQQRAFNAACVGRTLPVLFERKGRHEDQILGKSPYLQSVHVQGPEHLIGQIAPVRIEAAAKMSLTGTLLAAGREAA